LKNGDYDTAAVKQRCETKLGIVFRDGKHYNGWYALDGKRAAFVTVGKGHKFIAPGTYSAMARQLLLTTKEFDDLLMCPLTSADYERLVRERGSS
jgi:hypothetical protein